MNNRFVSLTPIARAAIGAAALALGSTGIARAQDAPTFAAPAPSYGVASHDEQIAGRINAITGKYSIQVRDNRGFIDNVTLHQGTIINPTGLTLQPGMQVTIDGTNAGTSFAANQISTPYSVAVLQPGYPAYNFGFGLGFGGWGGGYGWGGGGFRGGYWR